VHTITGTSSTSATAASTRAESRACSWVPNTTATARRTPNRATVYPTDPAMSPTATSATGTGHRIAPGTRASPPWRSRSVGSTHSEEVGTTCSIATAAATRSAGLLARIVVTITHTPLLANSWAGQARHLLCRSITLDQ